MRFVALAPPEAGKFQPFELRAGRRVVAGLSLKTFTLENVGAVALVSDLLVKPAFRGHGFGHAIMRKALRHLARQGVLRVLAEVREDNTPALKVCAVAGFTRLRRLRFGNDWWLYLVCALAASGAPGKALPANDLVPVRTPC